MSVIVGSETPCLVCQQVHRHLPRVLGTTAPDDWLAITAGERMESELTPDVCILPDSGVTRHFLRGHIQLPVADDDEPFIWSVWVELDPTSMSLLAQRWSDPNRASMPPFFGRLATELPYPESTKHLQVSVHNRDPGMAPLLMVTHAPDHPLDIEQRSGISLHRVSELVALVRH